MKNRSVSQVHGIPNCQVLLVSGKISALFRLKCQVRLQNVTNSIWQAVSAILDKPYKTYVYPIYSVCRILYQSEASNLWKVLTTNRFHTQPALVRSAQIPAFAFLKLYKIGYAFNVCDGRSKFKNHKYYRNLTRTPCASSKATFKTSISLICG